MPKEVGHWFFVVDSSDGLGQEDGDVHGFDLVTLQLLEVVGNGVCHNNLVNRRLLNQPVEKLNIFAYAI